MKKAVMIFAAVILAAVFLMSGYQVCLILRETKSAESTYQDLNRFVTLPGQAGNGTAAGTEFGKDGKKSPENGADSSKNGDGSGSVMPGKEAAGKEENCPEVDFESLRGMNSQTVGWIYGEDTKINYPVVQAKDNAYYLDHMFDGQKNANGCIFLDCGNQMDFSDSHSIIYGHHMKSGAMFAGLSQYKNQAYYEAHPRMLLLTPDGNYNVELFAGYVADVEEDAWQIGFESEENFSDWIDRSMAKSCISTDIVPSTSDKILTLSTCSYEFENARFVLLGILKFREGEENVSNVSSLRQTIVPD
ncbi:MAG: class B sortase [Lachnospiraceae bacterium]|nr:class B sortase [Lachnospiraceae bacterium]